LRKHAGGRERDEEDMVVEKLARVLIWIPFKMKVTTKRHATTH
jgi:hypothetical protein